MPSYWTLPSVEKCLVDSVTFSCTLPDEFEGDGDIAGPGVCNNIEPHLQEGADEKLKVFWSFFVAALLPIPAAIVGLIYEYLEYTAHGKEHHDDRRFYRDRRRFPDAFLISVGDTQIVTSVALLISVNFLMGCEISAYHYDLVCKLVLISSASHIASIAFVHQYFKRSRLLGGFRVLLILVTHAMGWDLIARRGRSHIFPNAQPKSNRRNSDQKLETSLVLPASCFIKHSGTSAVDSPRDFTASTHWNLDVTAIPMANSTLPKFENFRNDDDLRKNDIALYSLITVAIFLTFIASYILHRYRKDTGHPEMFRRRHYIAYSFRVLSSLIVYGVMAYGFVQFRSLQSWMLSSGWFGDDDGESNLQTFGQTMPLILLLLPFLAVFEEKATAKRVKKAKTEHKDGTGDSESRMHPNGK